MKKKIIYVITKSTWGGAQRYVYDLATNLPRDQFDITVAAGGTGLLFDKLQKAGIRTITISGLQRDINLLKEIASFWHLLKIFVHEKPDVVHLNSSKIGGLGAVAARLVSMASGQRSKVVFTVHGWGFNEPRNSLIRRAISLASWFSSLFQDTIICINARDYAQAQKFISQKKLILIYNGIHEPAFLSREESRQFLSKCIGRPITSDTIIVGTVAELTPNKGLSHLIDATYHMKSQIVNHKSQIIIIGDGEHKQLLQNKISSLGLSDTISLTGFVPDANHYLTGFDIFVLPSLKEGLPYTIIEAMATGLPIVAAAVGGIPDLIVNDDIGIAIPPKNPTHLAKSLVALMHDKERRNSLGAAAKKRFREIFSIRDMIEKTIFLYNA